MSLILSGFAGLIYTEFVGYFLHILLHSEKVPMLSRNHMLHHLREYGPQKSLRTDEYHKSTKGRAQFTGIGLEWVVPIAMIMVLTIASMTFLKMGALSQFVFVGASLFWGYVMFDYMHGAMHLSKFWMLRIPFLEQHFLRIRRLHDIHHREFTDEGRLLRNFGICFFFVDRIFGTFSNKHLAFNKAGFVAAEKRYATILQPKI